MSPSPRDLLDDSSNPDDESISDETCEGGISDADNSDDSFQLGKEETRVVNMLRAVVALVLIVATVGASFWVFSFTRNDEVNNFENAFLAHSSKAMDYLKTNVKNQLATMDSFSVALTSYARDQGLTFPFVALPDYDRRVHAALAPIHALSMLVVPRVTAEQRPQWEQYAIDKFPEWSAESQEFIAGGGYDLRYRNTSEEHEVDQGGSNNRRLAGSSPALNYSTGIANMIYTRNETGDTVPDPTVGPYFPLWQNAPYVPFKVENNNFGLVPHYRGGIDIAFNERKASMGQTRNLVGTDDPVLAVMLRALTNLIHTWGYDDAEVGKDPIGLLFYPIINIYNTKDANDTTGAANAQQDEGEVVGMLIMFLHWRSLFINILPDTAKGIDAVLTNTCGDVMSYRIIGSHATYLGNGDLHDPKYDHLEQSVSVVEAFNALLEAGTQYPGVPLSNNNCPYTLHVYPTDMLKETYITNGPWFYTIGVVAIFAFASFIFVLYDYTVETRQRTVMRNALKTNAIVSSLFPAQIANQLIENKEVNEKKGGYMSNKQRLKTFLNDGADKSTMGHEKPMADLFTATTVMVADIAGFTSWSSARDPAQVFILLQTIYQAFDKIAKKRKVFKVETVGDTYIAVTGIPEKQEDHALRISRFALDCLHKFNNLVRSLEVQLGPDTGDLKLRVGLHSGPCTAGVLRGDRARFQLFGDTINFAAKMESTCPSNRIQVSKATAQLLMDLGRNEMLIKPQDEVFIRGKGVVETWFLVPRRTNSVASSVCGSPGLTRQGKEDAKKTQRLIDWNVTILAEQLRKVVARRNAVNGSKQAYNPKDLTYTRNDRGGKTCLEELEDILAMPALDPETTKRECDPASIDLGPEVMAQLRQFVELIAARYHPNPFHNFEHASHVAMSVQKLLSRIVAPDIEVEEAPVDLHHFTHGINSDPLIHFAVVLSALIHDVDHRGISNTQLAKEDPAMAEIYKDKSIAEQNSVDVAWDILMSPEMTSLRTCIYTDKDELHRFRQAVIKVVLATDIFDKELNDLRKQRWNMAFAEQIVPTGMGANDVNVKATIVIEHLIQASDVSHTMQHWHIYRKWNERLFCELYDAFLAGRMGANPAEFWYNGELGFFDNYIIPLTKKLKECNVFGVSSAEYLSYAMTNREEWEQKGQQIVAEMLEKYSGASGDDTTNVGEKKNPNDASC